MPIVSSDDILAYRISRDLLRLGQLLYQCLSRRDRQRNIPCALTTHCQEISGVSGLDRIVVRLLRGGSEMADMGYSYAGADLIDCFAMYDKK